MKKDVIESVLISLRRIIRATDLYSRNLIKTSGLTSPQLLILQTLVNQNGCSVGDLASALNLSQATISSILDRLSARGMVAREKSTSDKRKTHITISDTGRKAIRNTPSPLQERFIKEFSALEDWEQTQILSSLQRIAHMMDAKDIDAAPVLDVGALDRQASINTAERKLSD